MKGTVLVKIDEKYFRPTEVELLIGATRLELTKLTGFGQYWCAAARRANLVVPEIGVLKWFLGSSSIASVNLGSECRF